MFLLNYSTVIDPILKDIRSFITQSSRIKEGDRVLDIGCGTGEQVFSYIKKGAIAQGIDKRKDMIDVAREKKKREKIEKASFRIVQAENLPFPDDSFDFASISLVLHEMKKRRRKMVFSEMRRVVKKEAPLILMDFQTPRPKNLVSAAIWAIEYLAGEENYSCFRDYLRNGGIYSLLQEAKLEPEEKNFFMRKDIAVIKIINKK